MLTTAARIIAVIVLVLSVGCKKDEAEESADKKNAQPEKVSKAQDNKATQKTAPSPPKARKLVKADKKAVGKKPRPTRTARTVKAPNAKKEAKGKAKPSKKPEPVVPAARTAKPPIAKADPIANAVNATGKDKPLAAGPRKRADSPPTNRPRVTGGSRSGSTAKARLPGRRGPRKIAPNAELLLRKEDLVDILKQKARLDVHELSGIDESGEYDGIYWGSPKGDKYIAGIQIWHPHSHLEAQRRYERMLRSYPNAQESTAITSKTFIAHWNDLIYLGFFDPGKQKVISLTCHRKVCNSPSKLVELGNRVKDRI